MFDVLVTGAETRQGVVVIRSLAKNGIRMLVTGEHPNSIGFYSKHISGRALVPSALSGKQAFVDRLLELAKKHHIPYIYPVTETSLIALNERRHEVEAVAKLLAPSYKTINEAIDKKHTLELATNLGVDTTKTIIPQSVDEAVNIAEKWGYPVIFKPRGQASNMRGNFDFKVQYIHNESQIIEFMRSCSGGIYPLMQNYAFGQHTQLHCFVERGEDVHSMFQDDMTRMLPLTGGIGARTMSINVSPELADMSTRLFQAMNWEGVAQTQWKGPGKDGKYRFIEVSVRIVASIGSLVHCGVDLPWMHYQYFTGRPVKRAESYIVGKPTRWLRGDTLTVMKYIVNDMQKSADQLPPKSDVFLSWLYDFVRPGLKHHVMSFSDPLPGVVELKYLVYDIVAILRRKLLDVFPIIVKIKRAIGL